MRISDAISPDTDLDVAFGAQTLKVRYRPPSYTVAELETLVAEAATRGTDPMKIVDSMRRLLVSWDLVKDDDTPVDIASDEDMRNVPTSIFIGIIRAVNADQSVGDAEGKV